MMDGRRHSVDVPISKTLVALRRVRSLRDPSTNSMSKFPALFENWETSSSNGINLGFENGPDEAGDPNTNERRLEGSRLCEKKEEHVSDHELYYGSRKSNSRLVSRETSRWVANVGHSSPRMIHVEESSIAVPNEELECGNQSLPERYGCGDIDKGVDFRCVTPSSDCVEGIGSCNAPSEGSMQVEKADYIASKRKCRYRKHIRSSRAAVGDVFSRVGSPCLSNSSALLEGSTRAISLYRNEDVDVVDPGYGCKISCCWSSTPRHRESDFLPNAEEQPLLLGAGQNFLSEQRNYIDNGINLNSGSPRSLAQKFRPKSFDELVGQNAVARSLLGAISNGQINPFYLFHGPRGTGKTSASRIFAAALNCLSHDLEKPCGLCQECLLFFSGRSRDVKEVDCVKINRMERIRSLTKSAELPPVSSRFKVFIVDECHLLREEAWATLFNNLQELSRHIVFILITPYLDRLPRSVVSRSQRYHFPKIKEADIAKKLEKMCVEEGLDFDQDALEFIGTKSTGSLRDAEMMLEQLSLLGKRITLSLVYELIGVVSDDELLDLLRLALSSDTSNTVKRARELMRSIDPMQLISQLANIIMDILAEKSQEGASEAKRKLFGRLASEADMQQLSHALRILTETEKQLRMSKNQTTWLTVALLQLSSVGSSFDANDSRPSVRALHPQDNDFCSTSSTGESLKHLNPCAYFRSGSCKVGMQEEPLEDIWSKATGICQSSSVKKFLQKRGKLLSICLDQGIAVAELAFNHPKYVSKAEKSWKLIASALQSTLGCNVEIRINLANFASSKKFAKVRKPSFNFFSCSRRRHHKSQSTTECESEPTRNSDFTFKGVTTMDKSVETCSSDCGSQVSHICCDGKVAVKTIRNSDGNALSIGVATHPRPLPVDLQKTNHLKVDYSGEKSNCGCEDLCALQVERQPGSFPSSASFQRKSNVSCNDQNLYYRNQAHNNLTLSSPSKRPSETYFCASDPSIYCTRSNDYINGSRDEHRPREYSKLHCWRTAMFPFRKGDRKSESKWTAERFVEGLLQN